MNITIKSKEIEIYKYYLVIINSLRPEKLQNLEMDVLSRLMYLDNKYSQYTKDQRDKIIFSTEAKKRIRESLEDMSDKQFNSILYTLRKKGLLNKEVLMVNVPQLKDKSLNINFNLVIHEEQSDSINQV